MDAQRGVPSIGNGGNDVHEEYATQNVRDEVFGAIGQHVQNLNLKDADDEEPVNDAEEPEEFRWGNEKVVEIIESLCMNCQENVCPHVRS